MSKLPTNLKYSPTHEWIRDEGDGTVTVGITGHAQESLGDLVFVDLPDAGSEVKAGGDCTVVESVKAASDIYSPVSGEVIAVNEALEGSPELVNDDPYGVGWMFKVRMSDPSQLAGLLDATGYTSTLEAQED